MRMLMGKGEDEQLENGAYRQNVSSSITIATSSQQNFEESRLLASSNTLTSTPTRGHPEVRGRMSIEDILNPAPGAKFGCNGGRSQAFAKVSRTTKIGTRGGGRASRATDYRNQLSSQRKQSIGSRQRPYGDVPEPLRLSRRPRTSAASSPRSDIFSRGRRQPSSNLLRAGRSAAMASRSFVPRPASTRSMDTREPLPTTPEAWE
ncbi:uncharacterized protein BP5553_02693 [Venustampulla echinocandica]|uniref:Uncharacterized protein n=1 Tax=Venustampulla echinocandica TaxID=2656787 RepID=A0A370TS71_9HELO|nr:uncharacterized protein BP5553_02693 [Venustampulla echinocandica]RDL38353.1 hypothetical protein BP5553_02693 [Venustampulla echinocandica]